jgi:hypothetical protein
MKQLATLLLLITCGIATAQSQFETGMQKAFMLWGEGKPAEASAMFERIAAAEQQNWLPYYYVALINTTEAFNTKDSQKVQALLAKAQDAQDNAIMMAPDNAELLVMQAMIHTAWIAYDPMTNGMKLSGKVNELYAKAMKLAPDNPRVVFCKAEFDMGAAAYFGNDTAPMCAEVARSVELFANFKPQTPFHPNWGRDRAQQKLAECKK